MLLASAISQAQRAVRDFDEQVCGHPRQTAPGHPASDDLAELRISLIEEEFLEVQEALDARPLAAIAKELCDLLYVTLGAANSFGIDLGPVFAEVHRSNMAKLGPDGKPLFREDGKLLKPAGWQPPVIELRGLV